MRWIYDQSSNSWKSIPKADGGMKLSPHKIYYNKDNNSYFRQNSDGTQTTVTLERDNTFSWTQPDGRKVKTVSPYKIKPEWPKANPDPKIVSQNLWQLENSQNAGLKKDGKYYPHKTANGNLDVANGIDLDKNPQYLPEARKGMTRSRANQISGSMVRPELPHIDRNLGKYTDRVDTISPQMKEGLMDMYWQLKNGMYDYQNLMKAIAEGDMKGIKRESMVKYKTPKGKMVEDKGRWNARLKHYFHY